MTDDDLIAHLISRYSGAYNVARIMVKDERLEKFSYAFKLIFLENVLSAAQALGLYPLEVMNDLIKDLTL